MHKKIMALTLALCMIFVAFTACTSNEKTEPTKTESKVRDGKTTRIRKHSRSG